jgi:hypothetical protein
MIANCGKCEVKATNDLREAINSIFLIPTQASHNQKKSPTDRRTQLLKLFPLGSSISWKKVFAFFAKI